MPGPITQVILQPTSLCNLNCNYCYVPNRRDTTLMESTVLEASIYQILASRLVGESVEFIWHAGEPLAAGIPYYELAVSLIDRYNTRNVAVQKSIQTNGTLVNQNWCEFFLRNEFSVGLSIDGPEFLHNQSRVNWSGVGSHKSVMRGFQRLKESGLEPGAICVLTNISLDFPDEIFRFFVDNGFHSLGFNVEEIENNNVYTSLRVDPNFTTTTKRYNAFFSRLFDLWAADPGRIAIREFDDLLRLIRQKVNDPDIFRVPLETVDFGIITIQKNGDITTYSPEFAGGKSDHYSNFVIGNILMTESIDNLVHSAVFDRIRMDVERSINSCASTCLYFDLCGGAFLSNKFFENGTINSTETTSCLLHRQELASLLIGKLSRSHAPVATI